MGPLGITAPACNRQSVANYTPADRQTGNFRSNSWILSDRVYLNSRWP